MTSSAIIVKRVKSNKNVNTTDIESLTRSANYEIVDKIIQVREESREYNIGSGKLNEIKERAYETNADAIIIDNEVGPYQMYNIGNELPDRVAVFNKYTLILDLFDKRARAKKPQLQVKLAKLRYELPRAEAKVKLSQRDENPGFMGLGEYDENQVKSIKDRIKNIKKKLSKIEKENEYRRGYQRDLGFNIVSIAGYTNAGKSTLLRQLASDHYVNENRESHNDIPPVAKSSEQFFTTLDTTTRKVAYDKRDILVTDTVGFIDNIPHWLIESFKATFDSIYESDVVLLVIDATDSISEIIRRASSSHDILSYRNEARIVTVLNKCDGISDAELQNKKEAIDFLAPTPVCISAKYGCNIEALKDRIHRTLPPFERDTLMLPLHPNSMSIISWLYNNANVSECEYTYDGVIIEYEAERNIINKAKSKLKNIQDFS